MMTGEEKRAMAALEDVYRQVGNMLGEAAACRLCGRCCRFKTYGHRLYSTHLEALYLIARSCKPRRPFSDDSCGYQEPPLCQAREGRVLGCRTFFCTGDTGLARRVHAWALDRIRSITDEFKLPWDYRPLGQHIAAVLEPISTEVQ